MATLHDTSNDIDSVMASKKKTKTKDKVKKKRLAERLRYQRLKKDPEQLKEKERQKYQKKKERGIRKLVKDMDRQEHKAAIKKWKEYSATYRAKRKALKEVKVSKRGFLV